MVDFLKNNMDEEISYEAKVLIGNIAEEIINCAKNEKIDLITMGTHGFKGYEKFLFGSVAEKVVKLAHCPVLSVKPHYLD